jgi:hypothetical protein
MGNVGEDLFRVLIILVIISANRDFYKRLSFSNPKNAVIICNWP